MSSILKRSRKNIGSAVKLNQDVDSKSKDTAEERIQYMSRDIDGRNSLEEFLMYALTNEPMVKFMNTVSLKDEQVPGKDWFEKLIGVLQNIIELALKAFGKETNRTKET